MPSLTLGLLTRAATKPHFLMTVQQTLSDLVAIDSVSARSNAELVAYLQTRCAALGLRIKSYPHTDDNGIEKINLVARTSDIAAVELALVGHTDTVPYDPNWNEALRLTEQDDKLFGRGSCDTKAIYRGGAHRN